MQQITAERLQEFVDATVGAGALDLDEAALDTRFADLGADSLAVYEIVTRIQDDLGVPIADELVDAMGTPRAMLDIVNSLVTQVG